MDDAVKQAMAKWPNVPHCFGWLGLDARGYWRMRDDAAQKHDQAGDRIAHVALLAFINRNYQSDANGRWYFQNGPQRVYVNLEATPYIAHFDAEQGFVLHTGQRLDRLDAGWLTERGQLVLQAGACVALLDDRDTARCLPLLQIDGKPASDDALLGWLEQPGAAIPLTLAYCEQQLLLGRLAYDKLASHFGFVAQPQPDQPA
jgi:hypothetical protein